jgi:DNA-binding beta-propeller fold protein YncE
MASTACECGDSGNSDPGACVDSDGDGYGENCLLGPDCDDSDPALNFSCDCAVVPHQGCDCAGDETESCFEADPKFAGKGLCHSGIRRCSGGKFGPCEGQALPAPEVCDRFDNDCDGRVDDGIQCADCGPRCFGQEIGPGTGTGFVVDDQNGRGLDLDPDGNVILEPGQHQTELTFLWVANSDEGTVSKVNTRTGAEEGRYVSALTSLDPRNRGSAPAGGANAPSRTAVDFNGDVWVANRAFNHQGTVTKIAHQDCVDINQNGRIDTSRDANGNGVIDMGDPAEFLGDADECILFTVNVGGVNGVPRALALDAGTADDGANAWVGCYNERRFYHLAYNDGRVLQTVDVPLHPYGAAIDSLGRVWTTQQNTGTISYIDTVTHTAGPIISLQGFSGSYGIAIDGKNRVWVGGYQQEGAASYDPATGQTLPGMTPGRRVGRGIAADGEGNIWLAHSWTTGGEYVGRVTRFKADDGSNLQTFDFPNGFETIGVGIDFDGCAWGINRNDGGIGTACRVDTQGSVACYPVGRGTYTYSDFTGFALRNFTAPRGTYRQVFEGCMPSVTTQWKQVSWEATVPAGTSLKVYVRAADTREAIPSSQRFGPFTTSPADLMAVGPVMGLFLQVEVEMASDVEGATPMLKRLGVQWICGADN